MSKRCAVRVVGVIAALLAIPAVAGATLLQQFNLDGLSTRADKIFRGTVTDVSPGTVKIGGGELPTVTYRFEVTEAFKGKFAVEKGNRRYAEVTMVGNLKTRANAATRFSLLRDVPQLRPGAEYLLFVTASSAYGLSTTVGLGQGCFRVEAGAAAEPTANFFGNAGLFKGTAFAPVSGALPYNELAARVRATLAAQ
jgi:hypothetical protein